MGSTPHFCSITPIVVIRMSSTNKPLRPLMCCFHIVSPRRLFDISDNKRSIFVITMHTGSNPCVNQFVRLFPNYLTTNCPNITLIEKIQKNPENIQSGSKIRKIYSLGRKSGSRIPEKFCTQNFHKIPF